MIGTTLAHYTILSSLGRGGMGEVWKARDTKLGRDVAIKTLPAEFAEDADRLVRFDREARLLASLNHPHIAAIYGLEQSGSTRFLVLELIEGDTLADVIARGPVPVEESLRLAQQIAKALEAAHDKGVVHRDLKPANIKVTDDGTVKVLDFGLAKFLVGDESRVSISNSPTISAAATQQGIILGTAAYMAPEQARGRAVDKRADVWAFGCVLFECLTGRMAFPGEDVSDVLASVLKSEPDWSSLPANLHPRLRPLLQRCLQKDPQKRYRDIGDVRIDMEEITDPSLIAPAEKAQATRWPSKLFWVAGLALLASTAAAAWLLKPTPAPAPRPVLRFVHELPETVSMSLAQPVIAVSPTGDQVVYATRDGLYIRRMDELEARRISGTEGEDTAGPFFSPDGLWVGYFDLGAGQLKKVRTSGGEPDFLAAAAGGGFGASWTKNGWILYIQQPRIMRVPENGGEPSLLVDAGERVVYPILLPDGDSLLFRVTSGSGAGVIVRSLASGKQTILFKDADSGIHYLASGHLVYGSGNDVYVRAFDSKTLAVGNRVALVQNFFRAFSTSAPQFQVSESGTLVYLPGTSRGTSAIQTQRKILAVLSRDGKPRPLPIRIAAFRYPRFSPDDKRIAVEIRNDDGSVNIWIYEFENNLLTQLTFDGGSTPLWSPDGKEVAYLKSNAIWTVPSNFTGAPKMLAGTEVAGNRGPGSWSPNGDVLLFGSEMGIHAWLRTNPAKTSEVIVPARGASVPLFPEFSEDGHWFVYTRPDPTTAAADLYVSPYPAGADDHRRITTGGGIFPLWIRAPQEILFTTPTGEDTARRGRGSRGGGTPGIPGVSGLSFFSLPITMEPSLVRHSPVKLFDLSDAIMGERERPYDVSHDGQRFIAAQRVPEETPQYAARGAPPAEGTRAPLRFHVVANWFEEIKGRVPAP